VASWRGKKKEKKKEGKGKPTELGIWKGKYSPCESGFAPKECGASGGGSDGILWISKTPG